MGDGPALRQPSTGSEVFVNALRLFVTRLEELQGIPLGGRLPHIGDDLVSERLFACVQEQIDV
jgi:hypothetical protein